MYTDDASLSFSSKSIALINECVNEDLGYLKSWLNANKLPLNVTKTQSLVIGGRKRLNDVEKQGGVKPLFNVGEETVFIIKQAKYLGVMVDQHLNWKEQISTIKKKASRGIGMLKYSKKYLPLLTIQTMYKSLVEPYFRYCCPVFNEGSIQKVGKHTFRDTLICMKSFNWNGACSIQDIIRHVDTALRRSHDHGCCCYTYISLGLCRWYSS